MSEAGSSALDLASLQPDATEARACPARPAMFGVRLRLAALVIVLLCVQVWIFLLLVEGRLDAGGYGLAHLGSCLAAWSVRRWVEKPPEKEGMSACILQMLVWTVFAGPFGTMVSVGLLTPVSLRDRPAGGREAAVKPSAAPRCDRLRCGLLDQHLRLQNTNAVRPLFDVIAEGTQTEKFEALSIIARFYEPAMAPTLRSALADGGAPVRVLAATVMAKLRMARLKKVGALQAEVASEPASSEPLRRLARARIELAESGLLDVSRSREEAARASEELASAAEIDRKTAPQRG
jgi:hypothetical protein